MEFVARNVNEVFFRIVQGIKDHSIPTVNRESRNGPVLQVPEPVLITYQRPCERVLFNEARDANPFFHLYEALWMLAGRKDVASVAAYNRQMREYSDDGVVFHGAYGYRWRSLWGFDQLERIIDELTTDPDSRRCVLQFWSALDDLGWKTKDKPCNTQAYFALSDTGSLVMTVMNRSNDLVWGLLGANVVHLSMLQEYMAYRIGVPVGPYHHFTNNLHCYLENWKPDLWLGCYKWRTMWSPKKIEYGPDIRTVPLISNVVHFERGLPIFVTNYGDRTPAEILSLEDNYAEPFLATVARPMLRSFCYHKQRDYPRAMLAVSEVAAEDWKWAGARWLERRHQQWMKKQERGNETARIEQA